MGGRNLYHIGKLLNGVDYEAEAWSARRLDQEGASTDGEHILAVALHVKNSGSGLWEPWNGVPAAGTIDHGTLLGLSDDDHTQYALLAGRNPGQRLIGGSAAGLFLDLEGNSVDAASIVRFLQDSVTAGVHATRWMAGGEVGTNTAAGTTTLTDTTKSWTTSAWVGAIVTCNGKTLTVTSNTATVLTGSGGWSGGGNPGSPFAYTIVPSGGGLEANPRLAVGYSSSAMTELLFGGGGAIALDTAFRRVSNTTVELRRLLTNASPNLRGIGSTATQPGWQIEGGSQGRIRFGPGSATPVDVDLTRVEANTFRIGVTQGALDLTTVGAGGAVHRNAPTTDTARLYATHETGKPGVFSISSTGEIRGPFGLPEGVLGNAVLAGIGGFTATLDIALPSGWGTLANPEVVFGAVAVALGLSSGWPELQLSTGGTIGDEAYLSWPASASGANHTRMDNNPMMQMRLALDSLTDIRVWIGYTNQTASVMVSADEPAGQYIGFRYSSAVDTNWRLVGKDSLGNFTNIDTTVAPVGFGSPQTLQLQIDTISAGITARIYDAFRVLSATPLSAVTSIGPASTVELRLVSGFETRTGGAKALYYESGQEVIRGATV